MGQPAEKLPAFESLEGVGEPAERKPEYESVLRAFEAVPSHKVGEIIDGVLSTMPRPAPRHAKASSRMNTLVDAPFGIGRDGPGGWLILTEPELHLGRDILVPDLAGWRLERMPELPETPYFTVAPDWVCEVLSPLTEALDRIKKRPIYAREGVKFAWLVNPLAQTLEVFELNADGIWMVMGLHQEKELVRARPFDAVELNLALLWA